MKNNFDACLQEILKREGGYVNHPQDPGGHTNKGITLKTYRAHFGDHKTVDELKNISDQDVRDIYKHDYWDKIEGDYLSAGVDLVVFDMAVNAGPRRALEIYNETRSIWGGPYDGEPITVERFIAKYTLQREQYYRSRSKFNVFGKGWLARSGAVMDVALELARKAWRDANPA